MKGWPHGSDRIRAEHITTGDVVVVAGLGAFLVKAVHDAPPLGRVAVLGWDSLALLLHTGTHVERLRPAPGAPHRPAAPHVAAATPSPATGGDPNHRPALPLAG